MSEVIREYAGQKVTAVVPVVQGATEGDVLPDATIALNRACAHAQPGLVATETKLVWQGPLSEAVQREDMASLAEYVDGDSDLTIWKFEAVAREGVAA